MSAVIIPIDCRRTAERVPTPEEDAKALWLPGSDLALDQVLQYRQLPAFIQGTEGVWFSGPMLAAVEAVDRYGHLDRAAKAAECVGVGNSLIDQAAHVLGAAATRINNAVWARAKVARQQIRMLDIPDHGHRAAADEELFAYTVAVNAHYGFYRKSGGPYIRHPAEVRSIIRAADKGRLDQETRTVLGVLALLHDVEEQAYSSEAGISPRATRSLYFSPFMLAKALWHFGYDEAKCLSIAASYARGTRATAVDGSKVSYPQFALSTQKDPKAELVRHADRHHNLTIDPMPMRQVSGKERSKIINKQTLYELAMHLTVDASKTWGPQYINHAKIVEEIPSITARAIGQHPIARSPRTRLGVELMGITVDSALTGSRLAPPAA